MPEENKNKTKSILNIVRKLPLFTINDIPDIGIMGASVRVKLYRLAKAGKIIRIKRGSYVSSAYLEHIRSTKMIDVYLEFLATSIYEPAYLSVEYVLQKHGILSESVQAITVITTNKKKRFINTLGIFTYRQVGENLFIGFNVEEKDGFVVSVATVAKALFDFLYLRKNLIKDKNAFENLRLNLDLLSANDLKEFTKYVNKENSKKMRLLASFIRQN